MIVYCCIMKIDIEKFSVDLICCILDFMDRNNEWKLFKDIYYDFDVEVVDYKQEEDMKWKQQWIIYIKRVIVYLFFYNINFK